MAKKFSPPWTPEELAVLHREYDGTTQRAKQLAERLGRSLPAVTRRAHMQRLVRKKRQWTPEEITHLHREYDGTNETTQKLAKDLNRSASAIHAKAHLIGLTDNRKWSAQEDALLEKHYPKRAERDLLYTLLAKRTAMAIITRAGQLGISSRQK